MRLLNCGWQDGSEFKIATHAAYNGGIEHHWKQGTTKPASSPRLRHWFEPTLWIDELAVGTPRRALNR